MKLLSVIYDNFQLLPFFIRHYLDLGVSEFWIGINKPNSEDRLEILDHLNDVRCRLTWTESKGIGGNVDQALMNRWRSELPIDEWFVVADLDEFIELPDPKWTLDTLVWKYGSLKLPYLWGPMIDRVAEGGRIPNKINQNIPLKLQFPIRTRLTRDVVKGAHLKTCIHQAWAPITSGHHPTNPKHREIQLPEPSYIVNHYRWCGDFKERLLHRVALRKNSMEYNNALQYMLRHNWKIDLTDPKLEVEHV